MLQIKGLGKSFRGEPLFRQLDFQINERDRIGLVGDNGTGKSTLMKILSRIVPPDEGEVVGARELTFGYLPQDGLFVRGAPCLKKAGRSSQICKGWRTSAAGSSMNWPKWHTPAPNMTGSSSGTPQCRSSSGCREAIRSMREWGQCFTAWVFREATGTGPARSSVVDGRCG